MRWAGERPNSGCALLLEMLPLDLLEREGETQKGRHQVLLRDSNRLLL